MENLAFIIVGGLALYIGWLHLQLHISRRVIQELQHTTLTATPVTPTNWRAPLAALAVLTLVVGLLLSKWL